VLADAIETVEHDAEQKRITLDVTIGDDIGPVAGDPGRLQQVVWNLLSNAVKFTPEGGRVAVSMIQSAQVAEITVADTGTGIRAEVLPHVFDRFHQADTSITRRFGGLGLGLSIVKHLVELHGGSVHAGSTGEGCGSTFTVRVPVAGRLQPQPARSAVPGDSVEPVGLDALRVLLVEDEPDTLEYLRRLLENHGAAVMTALTARDALEHFRRQPPDLLISDIGLPEMDGYDRIQQIRRDGRHSAEAMPAIALTAYARAEDRLRALRAGFNAHLSKPAEPAELLATAAGLAKLRDGLRHPKPR
jgi:CheY-like chemotaxis protein